MPIILRNAAGSVTVAEAKRLVLGALPREKSGEVYAQTDEKGELVDNGWIEVREVEGVQIYASFMDRDFVAICRHLEIQPRLKYRPIIADYTGVDPGQDETYTITHDEFVRFAGMYGVYVKPGDPPEVTATVPAPVPRHLSQELAIVDKLLSIGLDPKAMQKVPRGKVSPAKATVRAAFPHWSASKFKKAWQRLRDQGEIADAE